MGEPVETVTSDTLSRTVIGSFPQHTEQEADFGDPLNGWKVTGVPLDDGTAPIGVADLVLDRLAALAEQGARPTEDRDDAIRRVLGVDLVSHAHQWSGCALVAAGRRYHAGYGDSVPIHPATLASVTAAESTQVTNVLVRLGLVR